MGYEGSLPDVSIDSRIPATPIASGGGVCENSDLSDQETEQNGPCPWLDNVGLLTSRTLRLCIEEFSLTRLTSNPPIFDHAIKNSRDYYDAIRQKLKTRTKIIV